MNDSGIKVDMNAEDERSSLEKLLHRVIEIDSEAQKLTDKAENMKNEASSEIESRKKEFADKYTAETDKELKDFEEKTRNNAEHELRICRSEVDKQVILLEKRVSANKKVWIDSIYSEITKY